MASRKVDPLPPPDVTWECVDFRAEPSGTGLVAVYMNEDPDDPSVGSTSWTSVVGWMGLAKTGDASPMRRWVAAVLYSDYPEVGPADEIADTDPLQTFLGIYDPSSGQSFDEWLADVVPTAEPWATGEPMRIEIPQGARLVDIEGGDPVSDVRG